MNKPTLNNISRLCFAQFVDKNKSKVKRVDSRNVLEMNGNLYAFSTTEKPIIECRQFYEDCAGVVCFNIRSNKTYLVGLKDLQVDLSPNRITSKGVKAFSAKAQQCKQFEIQMHVI